MQPNVPLRELAEKITNWFNRPMVIFDCETTGNDPKVDRVIQFGALRLPELTVCELLIDPGFPIAPEVSEIHGITTEMVQGKPQFTEVAELIHTFMTEGGRLLAGYNVRGFDIKVLIEEFKRKQIEFPLPGTPIIDSCELFYRMEPRDLAAALNKYCGEKHELAHGAMPDVIGTVKVLAAQLTHYPDLPRNPAEFDLLTQRPKKPNWLDEQGKIQWWHGEATIAFGQKWKGKTLREVYSKDRSYFSWILREEFPADTKDIIREAYQGRFPVKEESQVEPVLNPPMIDVEHQQLIDYSDTSIP